MALEIRCDRCHQILTHVCNEDFSATLKRLYLFKLECRLDPDTLKGFKESPYYSEGDEDAPFFSEAFLYSLVGKEDARTILAFLHGLARAAGIDGHMTEHEAWQNQSDSTDTTR